MTRRQWVWLLAAVALIGGATMNHVLRNPDNKWWSQLPYRVKDYGPNETE